MYSNRMDFRIFYWMVRREEKEMRKGNKILCSHCNEKFYSLIKFYAHIRVCEKRKKWILKKLCWESKLQGGGKKRC